MPHHSSTIAAVTRFLILATLAAILWLQWAIRREQRFYTSVSIPWFNSIGQKIGLDNAITLPPIKG